MRTTRVVAAAAGLLLVATGLWALTAPRSSAVSVSINLLTSARVAAISGNSTL